MRDLKTLREGWEFIRAVEEELVTPLGVQEGASQFLELYTTFFPMLEQTENLFSSERETYLSELQMRLQKLAQLKSAQG